MIDISLVLSGDRLALSRFLSHIENETSLAQAALNEIYQKTGDAHLIGITGAPGTGKSSLVNQLAYHYRHPSDGRSQKSVAIVAVDPSSPFSGGAVLGDRIRMSSLTGDRGVFIRSMASRGSLGGLARATAGVVQAFDAAGYEVILIETVGAGQAEVDIARLAHTTIVVEAPGLGDDIQAIKAGILEIADILVVNKADRPGVEQTEKALRNMLQLAHPSKRMFGNQFQSEEAGNIDDIWIPEIFKTIATTASGIPELLGGINEHYQFLKKSGDFLRRERVRIAAEMDQRIQNALVQKWRSRVDLAEFDELLDKIVTRQLSPQQALKIIIGEDFQE